MNEKILVVDDDENIRQIIHFSLETANYSVIEACDGLQALQLFKKEKPNLVILDIGMPEMEGTDVCRQIRQHSQVPIIMLSARDDEFDRVLGLELGADDYVSKPFSNRELVARTKALLRRSTLTDSSMSRDQVILHGHLQLNPNTHQTWWNNLEVELTATEFEMLHTMMKRPGYVYTRDSLIDSSYKHNVAVCDRTIDSHLRRIRQKFKAAGGYPIETVHGVGYKINDCKTILTP
ncbi:response regulator transcription factor [Microbulbifer pacificus]|uniref:Response regulator transcription factor n=1 Tax=Microbulbifer pacificus TaxID=407164 RepID=A0AAU0MYN3_9GAMM|nr:response regulator transcription factor [Microbulbifer pacificus]WOX05311.1 response regulator transcription factor [Microbulbifer pacificus]